MSSALNRPALGVTAAVAVAVVAALAAMPLLSGCKAYKDELIGKRPSAAGGQGGEGGTAGGSSGTGGIDGDGGAGIGGDGGVCVPQPETCNDVDDDCDGVPDKSDEDTVAACEQIALNAETQCVVAQGRARCLKITCHVGFGDRDGDPTNGCETALDEGDGGSDEDAGR